MSVNCATGAPNVAANLASDSNRSLFHSFPVKSPSPLFPLPHQSHDKSHEKHRPSCYTEKRSIHPSREPSALSNYRYESIHKGTRMAADKDSKNARSKRILLYYPL